MFFAPINLFYKKFARVNWMRQTPILVDNPYLRLTSDNLRSTILRKSELWGYIYILHEIL